MKLKFFGDSYDILKKSFIEWLGVFGEWSAHPMFTEPVTAVEAEQFANFLGAKLLCNDCLTPQRNRTDYFSIGSTIGNLFLDPDTGVRLSTESGRRSVNYVFASELIEWSQTRPNSLTMVFDQSYSRGKQSELMTGKLEFFAEHGVYGFAYSSHAPFLFLSKDRDLVSSAYVQIVSGFGLPASRLVRLNGRRTQH